MNFLLKNLEYELDERHLLVGEKLLEDGRVIRLFENENHLWIAKVDGFEVEMQISPSKVRAYSCECNLFEKEGCCGHIAAGLLALRRKLSEKKIIAVESPREKPRQSQKLTVNAILDNISQDELAAFVRNFAKTNKQFSLALRTKFAIKVPLADDREKFSQLIDAAILSYRKANDRISSNGFGQLSKLIDELVGQAEDALALEHFAEAWAIISAIVSRFSPILKKIDAEEKQSIHLLQKAFDKMVLLAKSNIPHSLKEEIQDFCEASFNRPAYRMNGFAGILIEIWLATSNEIEAVKRILNAVDQELSKPNLDKAYRYQLLLAKMDILELEDFNSEKAAFTLDCLATPLLLTEVVEAIEPTGELFKVKDLAEKGYRLTPDDDLKQKLQGILYQIAQLEGEKNSVTAIARQRFLETKDFKFYEKCQENYQGNWNNFVKKLVAELVGRHDYRQNMGTIATILGREGKLEDLLKLIKEQDSLEFAQAFDHFLLKKKPLEVFQLYEHLLKNFLADHLGLQASKRMKTLFEHLQQLGHGGMADRLLDAMAQAFPKRIFYLEPSEEL